MRKFIGKRSCTRIIFFHTEMWHYLCDHSICPLQSKHPRYTGENLEKNKVLYTRLEILSTKYGCSAAQLALSWVLHQGEDVVPIPGRFFNISMLLISSVSSQMLRIIKLNMILYPSDKNMVVYLWIVISSVYLNLSSMQNISNNESTGTLLWNWTTAHFHIEVFAAKLVCCPLPVFCTNCSNRSLNNDAS